MVRPPRSCPDAPCFANWLRLSELTGLRRDDLSLTAGAHVRVVGKGRKERCTPLAKRTVAVLKEWLKEPAHGSENLVFTNAQGGRLSPDGVQYIVAKARGDSFSELLHTRDKRVTPHVFRHTAAMELLLAGVRSNSDRVVAGPRVYRDHADLPGRQSGYERRSLGKDPPDR